MENTSYIRLDTVHFFFDWKGSTIRSATVCTELKPKIKHIIDLNLELDSITFDNLRNSEHPGTLLDQGRIFAVVLATEIRDGKPLSTKVMQKPGDPAWTCSPDGIKDEIFKLLVPKIKDTLIARYYN